MLNVVFTTGHETFTYQRLDMRSCVHTKIYTKHKPTYRVQTQREQSNMFVIVSRWDNSRASCLFTPLSNQFCVIYCYYAWFGLLMQISLADYSAYLYGITNTYIRSILVSIDLFQGVL